MVIKYIGSVCSKIKKDISGIPDSYKEEFLDETLSLNLARGRILALAIVAWNVLLLIADITMFLEKRNTNPAYRHLFYAHIIMIVWLLCYIAVTRIKSGRIKLISRRTKRYVQQVTIIFVLAWSAYLAVNAQFTHGQISAYIIGVFCVASFLILTPCESIFMCFFSYLVFTAGMVIVQDNPEKLSGNLINSSFLTTLAYIVSRMHFAFRINDFTAKRIIVQKSRELDISHKNLEQAVRNRTEELIQVNDRLIHEMKMRHKAEIDTIKAQYLYNKKEEELNKALELDKLRAAFFTNISHEFKTPLNVIISAGQMLDLVIRKNCDTESYNKAYKYILSIRKNGYRMLRLISNLIDITRIDTGHFKIRPANNDIVRVVEDTIMLVAGYIENKNIKLVFDTETEEKIIACDSDMIERAILNLLSNSVKFTPKGGNIYVNIYLKDDKIMISVKDTGTGIPSDMLDSIFERFIQVDKTISSNMEGSGIGLSLVKSIVGMHNGSIRVESEFGNGSEFIIELPDYMLPDDICDNTEVISRSNKKQERISIELSDIS